ncbi:helix-turn-helix domain-containing protein [Paraburkholderia phenazinium]|jgi:DNA-binding Xre family transcriptional regulator|uniref:helix-turn-helix domain-containing protein n=1 Tax=Paraburkholderia phenazinium TaxID=60549 RepID=UPI001C0B2874|nr:helix-turn-helix transcriptional regulator [Paraburkholderia phenazinium]
MRKSEDALETTTPLGFIEPSSPSSGASILQFVFVPSPRLPAHRGDGRPLADLTAKYEADPRKLAALQRARGRLAEKIVEAKGGQRSLAAMRLAAGLSQTQLAEKTGILQPQIARLEAGAIANAGAKTIRKLREALGVSGDEILDSVSDDDAEHA